MTSGTTYKLWPGITLEVTQDVTSIMGGSEANPDWRHVDGHGHGHFWTGGDTRRGHVRGGQENYPTLEWVSVPCSMGHDDDCDSEGAWHCRECGEVATPGVRDAGELLVAGATTYRLTVGDGSVDTTYVFGPDKAAVLQEAILRSIRGTLASYEVEVQYRRR